MAKPTRKEAYDAAKAEVRNKMYTRPNKYTKWYFGNNTSCSWCGIFVAYILKKKLSAAYLLNGCNNIAYVPTIVNWAKKNNKITKDPKLMDLVIFDWTPGNGTVNRDHVGFFVKDLGNGYIQTLEGNTSNASNGDGNCVQIRKRSKSFVYCYVSLDYFSNVEETKSTVIEDKSTTVQEETKQSTETQTAENKTIEVKPTTEEVKKEEAVVKPTTKVTYPKYRTLAELNFRKEPNLKAEVLDKVAKGTVFTAKSEISKTGWVKTTKKINGKTTTGYIRVKTEKKTYCEEVK